MRVVVVGCGRVGAGLAESLARAGHTVTIVDINGDAFQRLEPDFPGNAIRADGTDEDILRRAGTAEADMFFALTEGDNRNILAAQLASETFGVKRVVAKVNDPVRAEAYAALGLATICRTRLMIDSLAQYAGLPADPGAHGVREPSGHHDHAAPPTNAAGAVASDASAGAVASDASAATVAK